MLSELRYTTHLGIWAHHRTISEGTVVLFYTGVANINIEIGVLIPNDTRTIAQTTGLQTALNAEQDTSALLTNMLSAVIVDSNNNVGIMSVPLSSRAPRLNENVECTKYDCTNLTATNTRKNRC